MARRRGRGKNNRKKGATREADAVAAGEPDDEHMARVARGEVPNETLLVRPKFDASFNPPQFRAAALKRNLLLVWHHAQRLYAEHPKATIQDVRYMLIDTYEEARDLALNRGFLFSMATERPRSIDDVTTISRIMVLLGAHEMLKKGTITDEQNHELMAQIAMRFHEEDKAASG